MALVLNEEQRLLRDTARDFLASTAPVSALRKLRDERDPLGYDPGLWQQMAELGWASIFLPEDYGGLDFGFAGTGIVMEECGRTLAASPLFTSAVVGASAVLLGGDDRQKAGNCRGRADARAGPGRVSSPPAHTHRLPCDRRGRGFCTRRQQDLCP